MSMDKQLAQTMDVLRIGFWRFAAALIGRAVTYKKEIVQIVRFAPYAVAGLGAFLLGRLFGEVLF
jgi:hypothetical protein